MFEFINAIDDGEFQEPQCALLFAHAKQRVCGDHSWKEAALPTFADKQSSEWPFCTPPKALVNPDGSLGEPNDVYTACIEHKLGINGKPDVHARLRGKRQGDRPPRR